MKTPEREAIVVGSGPNGLAAAITLAKAGRKVRVLEGKDRVGGGLRSSDNLTLPGFIHDPCSAIHPLGIASPFFRNLPLKELGLRWIFPPAAAAHPLDDGTAVLIRGRVDTTAEQFGRDARAYRMLMGPTVQNWQAILEEFLGPLRVPRHPVEIAPIWRLRTAACHRPCAHPVPRGAHAGRLCRHGGALDHATRPAGDIGVRHDAGNGGSRHRLAHGPGRLGADRRGAGRVPAWAGWGNRNGT